jgi:hypothetical protein
MHQTSEEPGIQAIYQSVFSLGSSTEFAVPQYSAQLELLARLLQVDLEQAIVWQSWDESRQGVEESPISYLVGSAGSAMGLFSVGYVLWALRGGALMTAMASSLPAWRLIDPTALLTAYRASRATTQDHVERMLGRG